MKKFLFSLLLFVCCCKAFAWGDEATNAPLKGHTAHSSVYDSLAFSMASWGVGLAVGIGLLCALLEFSTAHSHNGDED